MQGAIFSNKISSRETIKQPGNEHGTSTFKYLSSSGHHSENNVWTERTSSYGCWRETDEATTSAHRVATQMVICFFSSEHSPWALWAVFRPREAGSRAVLCWLSCVCRLCCGRPLPPLSLNLTTTPNPATTHQAARPSRWRTCQILPRLDERRVFLPAKLMNIFRFREYDKDPETFFRVMCSLDQEGMDFSVSVLGEEFDEVPGIATAHPTIQIKWLDVGPTCHEFPNSNFRREHPQTTVLNFVWTFFVCKFQKYFKRQRCYFRNTSHIGATNNQRMNSTMCWEWQMSSFQRQGTSSLELPCKLFSNC